MVKIVMKGVDVHVVLFDIFVGCTRGGPLRLRDFRHVGVAPHVYDRFIGAWGMFPYHDHVPLYFYKQLYYEFELHIHPEYISMPSNFYGSSRGCSYQHPRARRVPTFVPSCPRFFPPSG
jgi:hypothetical protein